MELQEIAILILGIIGGAAGIVPLVNGIKERLGWSGGLAAMLAAVASFVVAMLLLWAEGRYLPGPNQVSWPHLVEFFIAVLGLSQWVYMKFGK